MVAKAANGSSQIVPAQFCSPLNAPDKRSVAVNPLKAFEEHFKRQTPATANNGGQGTNADNAMMHLPGGQFIVKQNADGSLTAIPAVGCEMPQ